MALRHCLTLLLLTITFRFWVSTSQKRTPSQFQRRFLNQTRFISGPPSTCTCYCGFNPWPKHGGQVQVLTESRDKTTLRTNPYIRGIVAYVSDIHQEQQFHCLIDWAPLDSKNSKNGCGRFGYGIAGLRKRRKPTFAQFRNFLLPAFTPPHYGHTSFLLQGCNAYDDYDDDDSDGIFWWIWYELIDTDWYCGFEAMQQKLCLLDRLLVALVVVVKFCLIFGCCYYRRVYLVRRRALLVTRVPHNYTRVPVRVATTGPNGQTTYVYGYGSLPGQSLPPPYPGTQQPPYPGTQQPPPAYSRI